MNNPNFRTLDLNLLRVFDQVMSERNLTRAASNLAMTQPAVSNALRRLREAIGEELFVPGSTGVTPTSHADAIWPAVREVNALDAQGLQRRYRDILLGRGEPSGSLHLGLIDLARRSTAPLRLHEHTWRNAPFLALEAII